MAALDGTPDTHAEPAAPEPRARRLSFRKRLARAIAARMPKGLYARAIIIIVAPMVILQSVIAFVFMERHWELVTQRLSAAVTRDIAALIEMYESYPHQDDYETLRRISFETLGLNVAILPAGPLPNTGPKPFFSIVDRALSREITQRIGKPFWIDTVGRSNIVEVRIQLDDAVMRVFVRRSQTYASNSHIFLVWMVGTSLVLLVVAILFLRNQIRPITTLANAAESFGKGHPVPKDFRPRGAREVRKAALAFIEMRARIERNMEQRTAMLAGVSHDLRTVLTRFKLELELLPESAERDDMRADVVEMQEMLEHYLDFARGDAGEQAEPTNIEEMLESIRAAETITGRPLEVRWRGLSSVPVKPNAFKRAVVNLVENALRYGGAARVTGARDARALTITVEDDGPGIPAAHRADVFRPFFRLDAARNVDDGGTGLGLAIARDIAHGHGGDITLGDSDMGGLKAELRIPV